jgi:hypothetical protein
MSVVSTYMDVEKILLVVDAERTPELAFTQEIVEHDPRPNRDTVPELQPAVLTMDKSVDELLR